MRAGVKYEDGFPNWESPSKPRQGLVDGGSQGKIVKVAGNASHLKEVSSEVLSRGDSRSGASIVAHSHSRVRRGEASSMGSAHDIQFSVKQSIALRGGCNGRQGFTAFRSKAHSE